MLEQPVCVPVWLERTSRQPGTRSCGKAWPHFSAGIRLLARVRSEWWLQPGACEAARGGLRVAGRLDELNATLAGAPEDRARAEWTFHQRLPGLLEALRWHGAAAEAPRTAREPRPAFERFIAELVGRAGAR